MLSHQLLMSLCIKKAWEFQTLTLPNPAVAAMVVSGEGEILSLCAHQKSGAPHAEVLSLKEAYYKLTKDENIKNITNSQELHQILRNHHQNLFKDCSIYVTLEPCTCYGKTPPCAEILQSIGIKSVIIGALESTKNQGGKEMLEKSGARVTARILEKECQDLLLPFLCYQKKQRFSLFKLATRLDGDYKSGSISCSEAKIFTHNQRSVCDKIFVSQNTLRNDNPLLDARFCQEPFVFGAPDVGIFSRNPKTLDADARIFSHKREVDFYSTKKSLPKGFNIIEGGWKLFLALRDQIDMLLVHISPTLSAKNPPFSEQGLLQGMEDFSGELLHTQKLGEDALLWIKNS
ncbi:bifunctional diaminohydroxyphosphoribosylaminopyrimidine deaminase/5-amino-6-(5-phosphoribosylamino)uracil reductase RibD [Helicobacter mustelae]|uniref:Putative priboflavin-specific deaminase n=1 Tax=Helicobacter mustelae (strain ATCC 43772 / CCUG 25715 / CIP 103759 / LMG 18044 / NCTC 12198 / R85-136P) TaxID=679897 RepID=D3UHB6_HELM1|nr:bifunctional diaminohydroxyphosphoribosylaminopyrimidine deaminase/5-amino-6-(5-phosphoribosylamino)uracil reductase RibD [Helicobacter mustelae]CBG39888.1 putative priboflavin-specific deaminase [Helicobacter mustelae 12198]SQH71398.1 priboflavin-specific deaminase [Helicobacter mustelae]